MYHVEFIGKPGSGKSTIYNKLTNGNGILHGSTPVSYYLTSSNAMRFFPDKISHILSNQYWVRKERYKYILKFISNNPELLSIMGKELKNMNKSNRRHATMLLFQAMSKYELLQEKSEQKETVIIDEGLLIYSIFFCDVKNDNWNLPVELLQSIPYPDTVIHVQADPETCLERQINRPAGKTKMFANCSRKEAITRLNRREEQLKELSNFLNRKGVRIIKLDNDSCLPNITSVLNQI